MAALSLKISVVDQKLVKTMQFSPDTTVFDTCRMIRDKLNEAPLKEDDPSHSKYIISQQVI